MARGITVDWVFVRVRTVRRLAAAAGFVLVVVAALMLANRYFNPTPEAGAQRAIATAEQNRQQIDPTVLGAAWLDTVNEGDRDLEAARGAFSDQQWLEAEARATAANQRFTAVLGRQHGQTEGVGHFYAVDGRVQLQRAGEPDWQNAQLRLPVFNGDFVKTGRDGAAEILFIDGNLFRIGPNSLLEIHHRPAADESSGTVRMVVGRINVYTADSPSTVATDNAETQIQRQSKVAVDVDEEESRTRVATFEGSARVRNSSGAEVWVGDRELVTASRDGSLSDKRQIPQPPFLLEPHNNASYDIANDRVINLTWRRPSPTTAVHLQVSRSHRFLQDRLDVDVEDLSRDSARLQLVDAGTYFWRLATVEDADVVSEWSAVRRFRVFSSDRQTLLLDETPPELEVNPPQQLGHLFIVQGRTEAGAVISINGEVVELDSEGRFSKTVEVTRNGWNDLVIAAVDPSGNRTERRERVFVEEVY